MEEPHRYGVGVLEWVCYAGQLGASTALGDRIV